MKTMLLNPEAVDSFERNSVMWRICTMMGIFSKKEIFDSKFIRTSDSSIENLLGKKVIIVGNHSDMLKMDIPEYDFACWFDHPREHILLAVIPEPNGNNMLYNNPEINDQVRNFLEYCWISG